MKAAQILGRSLLLMSLPALFACECESGTGLGTALPLASRYFLGTDEEPAPLESYTPVQADGTITIDFGQVDASSQARRYLFVHAENRADLKIFRVEPEAGTSSDFSVLCQDPGTLAFGPCPVEDGEILMVAAGSDLLLQVFYAPRQVETDEGSLTIGSNAHDHPTITVNLRGEGVSPEIQACISDCTGPESACAGVPRTCNDQVAPADLVLDFGDSETGASLKRKLWIVNQGDRALEVQSLLFGSGDYNQFSWDPNGQDLPGILAAGAEVQIFIEYAPGLGGAHRASFQILSNDVNQRELKVVVRGSGLAPRACPQPLQLDFGNVPSGSESVLPLTIRNCGLLPLTLDNVALNSSSSSPDFGLASPPAFPVTLAPDLAVEVQVRYAPPGQGSDDGEVELFSDDPSSDPQSGLTGTVILTGSSTPRACDILATPYAVSFGGVLQGTAETVDLKISNQGTDSCTLNSAAVTINSPDNEFSVLLAPPADTDFAPGEILEVRLQYLPVGLGVDSGVLTLRGTDKDGNEIPVNLGGEGVATASCDLQVTPTSLRFGTVKLNNEQSMGLQLLNLGAGPCDLSPVELVKSTMFPSDFAITAGPAGAFTLARRGQPGSQQQVVVTFTPRQTDLHRAVVWFHTDDDPDFIVGQGTCYKPGLPPVSPQAGDGCISVSGFSAESDIQVVPAELDFGVVKVGCNSPELHATVYNLGSESLNISRIYLENEPDPNFQITSAPATPTVLAGGGSFVVRLRYHPQDSVAHRSNLYIESDASNVQTLAVPLIGEGTTSSDQVDTFQQPNRTKSDVLFVVDNSTSMDEEQNLLASNFDSFIQSTVVLDVDFQIGVIATEVNAPETAQGTPPRDINPGVLVHPPGRPAIITNTTANVAAAFADNVHIGTCCSDEQEAGLQAAWMALSPPLVNDPAANGGFLRDDAKLYIIVVSDEQDQSKGDESFYVDFFRTLKGQHNTDLMKVSAVCGPAPNGCSGANGSADSGSRYIDVATATQGISESICTNNWAQALSNLGLDAFTPIREFVLSRPANQTTITVTDNGQGVARASCQGCADGWTYYSGTNSVFFGDDVVPGKGDTIQIHYTAACL